MSQLAIGLVRTPVHSQSAKLQPFYEHLRIATSFLLSRSIGFVQFFNSICQISPFCICKHHQFDTLTLLTGECNGFVCVSSKHSSLWLMILLWGAPDQQSWHLLISWSPWTIKQINPILSSQPKFTDLWNSTNVCVNNFNVKDCHWICFFKWNFWLIDRHSVIIMNIRFHQSPTFFS